MSASTTKLTTDFIAELTQACLSSVKILDICKEHLQYHYLQTDFQKKIFKYLYDYSNLHNIMPTLGMISQTFRGDKDVVAFLAKVKSTSVLKEQHEGIVLKLEEYIKKSSFVHLYDEVSNLYTQGKHELAMKTLAEESPKIVEFSLSPKYYSTVFADFEERQAERQRKIRDNKVLAERCTFGIHEADQITFGGFNYGTSVLILARSGVGKSTALRWIGLANARLGKRVVHFQAEGSEEEVQDAYDAGWTGINMRDIETGEIPEDKLKKIERARRHIMENKGEIIIYASESFDSMSINKCREIMENITKTIGPIDLAIFDYLELFTVKGQYGNSDSAERKRREDIANKMTNLGIEFGCGIATATQSVDIKPDKYNNPEYVMTRSDISEFKGCLKPFSVFATLNQTDDEYAEEIMRWHFDKLRKYKKGQTFRFYQARDCGRFYDSHRTLEVFYQHDKYQ